MLSYLPKRNPMDNNPLKQYFRQPAIFIQLPSQGKFYKDGALVPTANGEYPVLPMTTLDEITYRTPDALFNGTAVANVIESCVPNIRDAWAMPGMDVDLDTAEGHDVMRRFADDSVAQGFEGIMIKSMDAPYECKRSDFWMKWKPTITVDLNIVGFEEGTGRNAGRLGAIICEGVDNDRTIRVNVGSGLSDSNRDEYWAARNELLDRVVEVEADAVTQNQDGSYSLRFPRFLRFRGFEAGEKL